MINLILLALLYAALVPAREPPPTHLQELICLHTTYTHPERPCRDTPRP